MGESAPVSRLFAAKLAALCGLLLVGIPQSSDAGDGWRTRVSASLQSVYDARRPATALSARFDSAGRVEADVHYNCQSRPPTVALQAAGLSVTGQTHLVPLCVVEGWIAPSALPGLVVVTDVTGVKIPSYTRHIRRPTLKVAAASAAAGSIDGNAVTIMHADQFVTQAGGGGAGVLVGVQSEGVTSLSVIEGRHELPSVKVFTAAAGGASSPSADEGTVLLEEVHAVAPNAGLAFCQPQTFVEYLACLQQFVNAGSTVMVDDVQFLDQDPMSSGGTNAQALGTFLVQNPDVAVFSAAGNDNGSYWEGSYAPVSVASVGLSPMTCPGNTQVDNFVNQFSGGANQVLTITTSTAISVPMTFAWADPTGHNNSNFDVYWTNTTNPSRSGCVSGTSSTDAVINPAITIYPGTNIVYIATPDAGQAGKFLKFWVGGDGLTALSLATAGSLVSPQSFAPGVISVGAVNGSDGLGNHIENFSSRGPITVVYPTPATIQAPALAAPDGIYVDAAGTYFASDLFPDGNFYGTSAAAPNAAAVAALLRGAFPNLTVVQLLAALQNGAAQLGTTVPDGSYGYGRVDAMGALDTLPGPAITALPDVSIDASSMTTSIALPFTVSGTGDLHFSASSTNAALIPASVVAAGAAGITIAPSDCGKKTATCSLTITAAQSQGGSATVTVSAVDGAGRSAPSTTHVTVSNPQTTQTAPPVAAAGKGSGGGGGSMSFWEILLVGALVLTQMVPARNPEIQ